MGKVVCVTGASGYIASWLVKLLLQNGYTVKATVRSLSDPTRVEHLKSFQGADERLHLFEADLINEGSFDSVVDGCECVFHTASPVFAKVNDPQKELIEPALKGTLNVLKSCKKALSMKRVVITSSMASLGFVRNPPRPDFIDETWFSDPTLCQEKKEWYALSKTLAEKEAWKFAEENGIDLITIHPGYAIGPLLQPNINFSCQCFIDLIKEGKDILPGGVYRYIDVRDIAQAHILAFENSSASGRYCLVGKVANSFQAMEILKKNFPKLIVSSIITADRATKPTYEVSKEKAQSLGLKFTSLEVTIKDTVQSLKDKNFLSF